MRQARFLTTWDQHAVAQQEEVEEEEEEEHYIGAVLSINPTEASGICLGTTIDKTEMKR